MKHKICTKCKLQKRSDMFANKKLSSGRITKHSQCRKCRQIDTLKWRKKNREKIAGYNKKYKNRLLNSKDKHDQEVLKNIQEGIRVWYTENKDNFIKQVNVYNKQRDDGLYSKYWAMIRRCKYPSQEGYKYYGGKGILVEWKSYHDFKKDMYESYIKHTEENGHKQTTLDRINNNGNYCKENCRWATYKVQNNNRTNNIKK